ncbi:MAG: isochorismatase family protein [Sedimentisphaerales bacterium]|nr:isochorismatase family protein [Sedimentisphaerales bacterium]
MPKLSAPALAQETNNSKTPKLTLELRNQIETEKNSAKFIYRTSKAQWDPARTAIIICDMWDQHWCKGATQRVAELAPHINDFVTIARQKGIFIIHAPSDTVSYYKNHPARKLAQAAPKADNLPPHINQWCSWINDAEKATYPIDQTDGGCDCMPKCPQHSPWRKQIASINISDQDAISASGTEIWNLMEQRKIENVILVGVHTNMCVLGRPFGLRNMARYGKNVVLVRDLTDTMHNSRMSPFVSHFTGTDLIIDHIEKYICPTISSTALTSQSAFRFKNDKRSKVVFISAESEYGAAETLPQLARQLQLKYKLACEVLQGSTNTQGKDRNNIPGMETLVDADLVVLFARRRALPARQMQYLKDYLARSKPLIALRTSSHAFALRGELPEELPEGLPEGQPEGLLQWKNFDTEVLGCNYNGYPHGETLVSIIPDAADHPILKGLKGPYQIRETMYHSLPLTPSCRPLLTGKCIDGSDDNPRYKKTDAHVPDEPVAWTNIYHNSRIFYTSLGSVRASFQQKWFQQMMINAIFWAMDKPVPEIETNTALH